MSTVAAPAMPCIYDGLQQPPISTQPIAQQPGKELSPKSQDDVIQPVPEPFKGATVVNHNNNTISLPSHQQHHRNVSVTANCYLQMLTSPLKTYRERKAATAENNVVIDETKGSGDSNNNSMEKSNFQKDMETAMELIGAIGYAIYGITIAVFLSLIPRRFRYKDITDQVVLVTGAGSGIGRLMAKKLALNHGAVIVAWDINKAGKNLI